MRVNVRVKVTGLENLPLHDLDQNRIWCAVVALGCELIAWLQMLILMGHPARRWEPVILVHIRRCLSVVGLSLLCPRGASTPRG